MSTETLSPQRVDISQLQEVSTGELPPWPAEIRNDTYKHSAYEVFAGEFSAYIYASDPGTLNIADYPFDEYVLVMSGTSVLTDSAGVSQTFKAGDSFMVPKGFTGTWELQGDYRELFIMESQSMAAGFEKLGFA